MRMHQKETAALWLSAVLLGVSPAVLAEENATEEWIPQEWVEEEAWETALEETEPDLWVRLPRETKPNAPAKAVDGTPWAGEELLEGLETELWEELMEMPEDGFAAWLFEEEMAEEPDARSVDEEPDKEPDAQPHLAEESPIGTPEPEVEGRLLEEAAEEVDAVRDRSASAGTIDTALEKTGERLAADAAKYTPQVSSISGEWQILGLARSGQTVDPSVIRGYLENVTETLKEKNGILHTKKYTEYSRVVLALTALGEDVTDVAGYNLLQPLADFDQTVWQGLNGAVFALLAFDSHDYEIPAAKSGETQTTRVGLLNFILQKELSSGGWALTGTNADPDVTAMVLQALARYYEESDIVKQAVERGLNRLSALQNADGGYGSGDTYSSESCAQVIVALTALGIDPNTDGRFQKNGKSVVDALLAFDAGEGMFRHTASGAADQMATEQAYYALSAYERMQNGQSALYDMRDVVLPSDREKAETVQKQLLALPAKVTEADRPVVTAAAQAYEGLSDLQKTLVLEDAAQTLRDAVKALEAEEETETPPSQSETEKNGAKGGSAGTGKGTKPANGNGGTKSTEKSAAKPAGGSSGKETTDPLQGLTEKNWDQDEEPQPSSAQNETGSRQPTGVTKSVDLTNGSGNSAAGSARSAAAASGSSASAGTGTAGSQEPNPQEAETLPEKEKRSENKTETEMPAETETKSEGEPEAETEGVSETEEETKAKDAPASGVDAAKIRAALRKLLTENGRNRLPRDARDYTQKQKNALLQIYRACRSLEEAQRLQLEADPLWESFLQAAGKLGKELHADPSAGVDLRDNDEEILPWYVRLEAREQSWDSARKEEILEILKEKGAVCALYEIRLINLLDGSVWQPEEAVRVSLPLGEAAAFANTAVVHFRDGAGPELLRGYISRDRLEFDTDHFSPFGVIGLEGTMEDLMSAPEEKAAWKYLLPGGIAAALLIVLLGIRAANGPKKKEETERA